MKKITLQHLANLSGCTVSTVSRALHGNSRISKETRERILCLARERHYLAPPGSRTVAVISYLADFSPDYYIQHLMFLVAKELQKEQYRTIVVFPQDLSLLNSLYISGVISLMPFHHIAHSWSALSPIPLVTINDYSEYFDSIFSVCSDEIHAVRDVMEQLFACGCRSPGFFSAAAETYCSKKRLETYLEMIECRGIPPRIFSVSHKSCLNDIPQLNECDSFILPGENLCYLAPKIHAAVPNALLAVWRYSQENIPNEICVVQDYARIAQQVVALLGKRITNGSNLHDEHIRCLVDNRILHG